MRKLRILLADDHTVVREGLKALISSQQDMEVIAEADDGEEAWRKAKDCQPDIVVMDVSMPRLSGVQATERIRQECPEIKVLVLTAYEDKSYPRQLLKAGASGFLMKRAAADELINAIRLVATGGIYVAPNMADKVIDSFVGRQPPKEPGQAESLSEREAEVMRQMAWGYTNKEIANSLGISVKTVETYKTRLMTKLNLKSRVDIVRYALREGWLHVPHDLSTLIFLSVMTMSEFS